MRRQRATPLARFPLALALVFALPAAAEPITVHDAFGNCWIDWSSGVEGVLASYVFWVISS